MTAVENLNPLRQACAAIMLFLNRMLLWGVFSVHSCVQELITLSSALQQD
jgi:hypothetical protein